jgi:hypothetical protein
MTARSPRIGVFVFHIIGHYEISRDGDVIRVWSSPEFNLEARASTRST